MSKTSVTAMLTAGLVCSVAGQTGSWSLSSGWGVDTSVAGIEAIHMIHLPVLPAGQFVVWDANYYDHMSTFWRYWTPPFGINLGSLSSVQTLSVAGMCILMTEV